MNNLPKPFFVLAPMDDVTDTVFRQIIESLYLREGNWATQTDAAQGGREEQTEPYLNTVKGVPQRTNTAMRRKLGGMTGSASQQVKAVGGPDLYFTEFVNVDGLMSPGRPKLLKKLRFSKKEGPLVAQLWGLKPENFEAIARQIADGTIQRELGIPSCPVHHSSSSSAFYQRGTDRAVSKYGEGSITAEKSAGTEKSGRVSGFARKQVGRCVCGFVGIDLNMGCPAKSEVQNGACSALIKNRPLAKEIIEATKRGAGNMPVSVKTRLGYSEIDLTWHEFLLGFDLSMLTIHGRTRKEMSKVPAHWDTIGEIAKIRDNVAKNTLIVGNGDVQSKAHGRELSGLYNLDGIMIGRGIFNDPYLFSDNSPWESKTREQRIKLYRDHVQLFASTWQNNERNIKTLNKFCKVYINGFNGAKELRERMMAANSIEELLDIIQSS